MRRTLRSERGMSLAEVTVVLAVVTILTLIAYEMIDLTVRASMFNESHNDLAAFAQRTVNRIQTEGFQSRVAFQGDATGNAYLGALQLPAQYPVLANSQLPVFDPGTALDPDSGTGTDRRTGNSLLIARQLAPLPVLYDNDANPLTAPVQFMADVYTFEYFFLSRNTTRRFGDTGGSLDLLQSVSGTYADYFQLSGLTTAAQRQSVAQALSAAGISRAWDPNQPIDNAFYALPTTNGNFGRPLNTPRIAMTKTTSMLPEMSGGRISGRMDYSVAFQPSSGPAFPIRNSLSYYAVPDTTLPGFPSGFEVKVAGPMQNRKLLARIVLMSRYGAGTIESQQGFVTTSVRF